MEIKTEIFNSHDINYPYPLFYSDNDKELFYDENFSFRIPPIYIHEIKDVIFDENTILKGYTVLDQFLRHNQVNIFNKFRRAVKTRFQPYKSRQKVIIGFQVWGNNYFHWMTETLPAILAMQQHINQALVMLPESLYRISFIKDILEMLSIEFEIFKSGEAIRTESIFAIQLPHVARFNHDYLYTAVRKLKKSVEISNNVIPFRKIYISRDKARRRKITNELALIDLLEHKGFEIHVLENYSLKQQIQLFTEASFVLSNHGAGLTNIMFMNRGSSVLELKSQNNNYWCFFSLANVFGLQYIYKLCKGNSLNHRDADILVDLNELSTLLDKIEIPVC